MRLFNWFRNNRATVNGVLITVFTSLIFNTISDADGNLFYDYKSVFRQIFEIKTLGGMLTIASVALLALVNAWYKIVLWKLNNNSISQEFPTLMKQYTSSNLVDSVGNGCLSWGEGKTVEICNDIILGWKPRNIVIENYDDVMYSFYKKEEQVKKFGKKRYYFNENDYNSFYRSDLFQEVVRKGNNLPRFMVRGCQKNHDKQDRKLLISLGRTEWSQTSYVWDRFGKSIGNEVDSNTLMSEYSKGISSGNESEPYLPNSFCMHLLIETMDGKVILSRISKAKINDNPGTWAATLGEQIEFEDFSDGNGFMPDFVVLWMRRAFKEEYKFDENTYADIVDEPSLRAVSVDFESDRYNFSLLCIVKLRYSFDVFYRKVAPILSTEEAIELKELDAEEIPQVLLTYRDEDKRKEYHPSTYLRLLLYLIHKCGYSRAEKMILNAAGIASR